MQNKINIARSYAQSIFDFAVKKKSLKYWKNFLKFLYKICQNKKISSFFFEIYSKNIIFQILSCCLKKIINQYSKNFIKLLILYKRLNLVPYILNLFIGLYNQYYNIININLIFPNSITVQKKKEILFFLEKKIKKKIHLTIQIKPSILNGVILKYDNFIVSHCILNSFKVFSNFFLS